MSDSLPDQLTCEECDRVQQCLRAPCSRLVQRGTYPRDLRGGYDYWKAVAKSWGDEMDRLRAENEALKITLDNAHKDWRMKVETLQRALEGIERLPGLHPGDWATVGRRAVSKAGQALGRSVETDEQEAT